MSKRSKFRAAGAATLVAVAGAAAVAVPSSEAQYNNPPSPVTITMKAKGKKFRFNGPSKVQAGAKLTFVMKDNPRKTGPHTASLVDPAGVPAKSDRKACENLEFPLCAAIAKAHKVEFAEGGPPTIGAPDVDKGKTGWDKAFGKKGDTWYTETKGAKETRKVLAKAGSKITFFCVVHPTMVKTLKVTK